MDKKNLDQNHMVISESAATQSPVVFKPKNSNLKYGFIAAICGLVLLTGIFAFQANKATESKDDNTIVYLEARTAINARDNLKLHTIATAIKKTSHYNTDPNLLYILTIDSINQSDPKQANIYLTQLEKIYDPNKGLAGLAGSTLEPFKQMHTEITYLQNYIKDNAHNNINYNEASAGGPSTVSPTGKP